MNEISGLNDYLGSLNTRDKTTIEGEVEFISSTTIPDTIYSEVQKWYLINKVSVLFVDMVNSSQIDYETHKKTSAKIYETFTGSLIRVMYDFGAKYVEIQGDGAFAIFDGQSTCARAFITATTFRTYIHRHLSNRIRTKTKGRVEIGVRAGISFGDIIVKRIGTRKQRNEVWAYVRVNQAAKLAALAKPNSLAVSSDAYDRLRKIEWIEYSCGCSEGVEGGPKKRLWSEIAQKIVDDANVPGIDRAYELSTFWCPKHGDEYISRIIEKCDLRLPKFQLNDLE